MEPEPVHLAQAAPAARGACLSFLIICLEKQHFPPYIPDAIGSSISDIYIPHSSGMVCCADCMRNTNIATMPTVHTQPVTELSLKNKYVTSVNSHKPL